LAEFEELAVKYLEPFHPCPSGRAPHFTLMPSLRDSVLLISALTLIILNAGHASERPDPTRLTASKSDCVTRLALKGVLAERPETISPPPYPACKIAESLVLISVKDMARSGNPIAFPDRPLLSCEMAERLAEFSVANAAPLARSTYKTSVASIATGPGYECRPRNRQVGAKISSHGQGNAIDIATINLDDGRVISIEKPNGVETVKFLTALRFSACAAFNTVLGPGSDDAHANHIHIDIEPRGKSGNSKFCQ
jgi:hypothetical protein